MNQAQITLARLRFGRWLKARREQVGLKQADVAKPLGYTNPQFISNWERGISDPPVGAYVVLMRLYKIRKDEAIAKYRELKLLPVEREVGKLREAIG